ncbi:uncharacterized protein N0V89_000699 [Didymosphaeria variabile]|uniref:F-box domain-containing protein n=1 Tax=Didymosphaeria variabile TaxID=1932322 RepID=A0A9W9CFY3_9PLEO|nr:uncharacterized protein N0V89_000699 [Didymosphaeria variabile]KAJ4360139.1 hypothetical protein N0V89_000699 [Didymosphaeria variabile]
MFPEDMESSHNYFTRSYRAHAQGGQSSDSPDNNGSYSASSSSHAQYSAAGSKPDRSARFHPQDPTNAYDDAGSHVLASPPLTREPSNRSSSTAFRDRTFRRLNNKNNRRRGRASSVPEDQARLSSEYFENNLQPSLFAGIDAADYPTSDEGQGGPSSSFQLLPSQHRPTIALAPPQASFSVTLDAADLEDFEAQPMFTRDPASEGWHEIGIDAELHDNLDATPNVWRRINLHRALSHSSVDDAMRKGKFEPSKPKHAKEKFESLDSKDVVATLSSQEAVAVMMYRNTSADPLANDVWPELRDSSKLPARYHRVDRALKKQPGPKPRRRPAKLLKTHQSADVTTTHPRHTSSGRPRWLLPVELVEMIASYLNRDDIKSLRLVSRELNQNVSQALFKTVVVPFNTEIYGMLGQEQDLDIKGKKKAGTSNFHWKNANGDDVYNGHGLDVFRGFGAHIIRYGMSFEVSEVALAKPPSKILTEQHESFWGTFHWPFVEYRRFEDVAGLESAADETPRMKTAFSELAKVQELALSVDAGLGWLNGPDRSIRARILERLPEVFGTLKEIPDRRTYAQRELWEHIEACHAAAESDLSLATLYKLEAIRPPSDTQVADLALEQQPEIPYVEPRIVFEALPHDTTDLLVPMSFDDPEVLDRFVAPQAPSSSGILYTSKIQPIDAGQLISPVIPSTLTKAQKEWLMETEWAQRAFISSYMLSIIDNPKTFHLVHTLNISRLSDRYISLLNRQDFWSALPNLEKVTLMVLPCWRAITKDDAGVVDTPKINPSSEIDSLIALLKRIVNDRPKVHTLTIGWATGGEHAEGVHARNKLLQPAPLLGTDMITNQTAAALRMALVQFPYVERLTLKNCWVTPLLVQEFVRIHDNLNLKHLVLDSVSLTGVLRPQQNIAVAAQQANNLGGNPWVPGLAQAQALHAHALGVQGNGQGQQHNVLNPLQFFQAQFQLLQIQLHQLQNVPGGNPVQMHALQAQLQHLATHGPGQLNNGNNGNANQLHVQPPLMNTIQQILQNHGQVQGQPVPQAPVAAAGAPSATNNQTLLTTRPREGSWVDVIDVITPGPNLKDFGSEHSQADEERTTSLKSIEFVSCGYARLPYSSFEQGNLEDLNGAGRRRTDPVFTKRAQTLLPSMLSAKWPLLGEIVQESSAEELATLYAAWNLEAGWKDADLAKAPQFDGLLPGGTGRFTGTVRADDRLTYEEATAS